MRENETIQNTPLIRKIKQFWIPEGWNKLKMKDLFNFFSGISLSRNQLSEEGIPCLHYGDIHNSSRNAIDINIEGNSLGRTNGKLARKSTFLSDGDVVFVDASEDYEGTNRYVVVSNKQGAPFLAGLHTIVARKKSRDLLNSYLKYCFETPRINRQFRFYVTGISVYGISKHNLGKIVVPVPPTKEQGAIAEILSTCDRVIELKKKLVEEKIKIKKWLMQTLLTGMIRVKDIENRTPYEELKKRIEQIRSGQVPEGYRKTELGIISHDWEITGLEKICKLIIDKRGKTPKKNSSDGDIPGLSAHNVKMGKIDFTFPTTYYSEDVFNRWMKNEKIEREDIIMTTEAPLGNIALVEEARKYILGQRVVALRLKDSVNSTFGKHLLMSNVFQRKLQELATGTTAKGLSKRNLKYLKIYIPDTETQEAVSSILSTADKEIDLLNKDLEQWEIKKKSLMQLLLTGIVRVSTEN
jgi:type I restriction enzyme S subunit